MMKQLFFFHLFTFYTSSRVLGISAYFLLFTLNCTDQASDTEQLTPTFSLIKSIPVNASFCTTDNLEQLYTVVDDELSKYSDNGILLHTYSNKILGNISFVDAANPLRLLLFYRDFVQIVFLDKTLSAIGGNILLENLGYEQAILTCTSNNNGFWLYDTQDFQLIRLDQNLKTTHNSGPINQLLGIEILPNYLIEYNNFIYLNDPERGILVFDIYGTYYKTIPLKGLASFQVIGDNLFYFSNNTLNSHHLKTLEASTIDLPDTGIVSVRIEKQKLFLLKEKSLDIYSINH